MMFKEEIMRYIFIIFLYALQMIFAETLFEVKDSSNNKVLDVSSDGLRVLNQGDTLMVISSDAIRANIGQTTKGLSRSFCISTASSKGKGLINALEVDAGSTMMREGIQGQKYTDFSPENIFIGLNSGRITTPETNNNGQSNVFVGNGTGYSNIMGNDNVFIGKNAGYSNIGTADWLNGDYNVFVGYGAGYSNTSGGCNVFLGDEAGYHNSTGLHNIFIGTETGKNCTTGGGNTIVGSDSWYSGNGDYNTFLGHLSGMYCNGSSNVYLGYQAGNGAHGSSNVFIGNQAGSGFSMSNRLIIDNTSTQYPLIYGEFDNDSVKINGNLAAITLRAEETTASSDYPAIFGKHAVTDNWGVGVKGESRWRAIEGDASTASGTGTGLYGYATGDGSGNRYGVYGTASGTGTGTRYGVYGYAAGGDAAWAGYFNGNVYAANLKRSADETIIDHPLDPENKYLSHSSISSDQRLNVYNGNAIVGKNGKAVVELPDWFESYNKDFKYQLTAIGAPGPNLYISKKINNNKFEISGGTENMEVSWQITGVRNDKFAQKNSFSVESEKKNDEKGFYVNPEAYGYDVSKGINSKNLNESKK
jgi:hypothetical protein